MLLADDVLRKALLVRDDPAKYIVESEALKKAIDAWTTKTFANQIEKERIDALTNMLTSNERFRCDLATAANWDQPEESIWELILRAVTAIQKRKDENLPSLFEGETLKWADWKNEPDLDRLQTFLIDNSKVRTKLAVELRDYPGLKRLDGLAERVSDLLPSVISAGTPPAGREPVFKVLQRHILNWETFSAGKPKPLPTDDQEDPQKVAAWLEHKQRAESQELHLKNILEDDYAFREFVAEAIKALNSEAQELGLLAVEMWRSIPRGWKRPSRDELPPELLPKIRKFLERTAFDLEMWKALWPGRKRTSLVEDEHRKNRKAIPPELLATDQKEPDEKGWKEVENNLATRFASRPEDAVRLWEAMEWPYPFSLVLREELRQVEQRRSFLTGDDGSDNKGQDSPHPAKVQQGPAAPAGLKQRSGGKVTKTDNVTAGAAPPPPENGGPPLVPPVRFTADDAPDASDYAVRMRLFGVAFSGGGIRSATFNLGVLQKLSDFGLLCEVDYLSTVSGGGYIGSWLTGWIRKNQAKDYGKFLGQLKELLAPKIQDPRADSQRPVRFLREFSNYLTPRLGSFSLDTWTMAAVYSRNLILNQATLIAFLGLLLLIPRLLISVGGIQVVFSAFWIWLGGVVAFLLLSAGVYSMSENIRSAVDPRVNPNWMDLFLGEHVQLTVLAPFMAAICLGSFLIWLNESFLCSNTIWVASFVFSIGVFLALILVWRGGFIAEFFEQQVYGGWGWFFAVLLVVVVVPSATMSGLFLFDLSAVHALMQMGNAGMEQAMIWSPVMLLAVLIIPGTLQVGLMGMDFPDAGREWLSRFRAMCSIAAVYWIAFSGIVVYGPLLALSLYGPAKKGAHAWFSTLTVGWIITTIGGILAGKSKKTGTDKEGAPKLSALQLLARIAPPVFIVGLMLLLSTAEWVILAHGQGLALNVDALKCQYWTIPAVHHFFDRDGWYVDHLGWLLLGLLLATVILAWRVDVNEFSMHHFYKNRLVRCYLGASNERRKPNKFIGFDARDDLRLALLKAIPGKGKPYRGPYPIVNTTLNLSVGEQLAWQERKGASFILSPCFCGFDVQGWAFSIAGKAKGSSALPRTQTLLPAGYRKTENYTHKDGPFLGTSLSISGAAANPNQGYNTSPAVAFLMTMFDVRLGWWVGNPRQQTAWKESSPGFGLFALLGELVGMTTDTSRFVNLSDGGHFDNMGLYELVRRRCSLILLSDAEQDPEFKFEGLGSAIRKCRIDFGAHVEIDTSLIRPGRDGKPSGTHCAVGRIRYLDGSEGTLVYIKPSLTGDEPEDVIQYQRAHADFPHETTADQWFTESQFESYRALGYHATDHSLTPAGGWIDWNPEKPDIPEFVNALRDCWYPNNPNLTENASRHTATLTKILAAIRKTTKLQVLGRQLFPGLTVPKPSNKVATQEFYFSLCILQLVEDIYFDFKLDRKVWADDPRIGGWRQLFKTWKNVPEVAAAWSSARNTFRKDFQIFWDKL